MLAHELRNPLAPIRNALQHPAARRSDGEAVQSACEMMERQVGQMVRLVDDLLDVSRISRGKIELRKERIELASVVNHAVEAARPLFECMEHELTVTLPPQPIYLERRPDPPGSGRGQPAEQRLQVHRRGRSHLADGRARGRAGRRSECGTTASASPPISFRVSSRCSCRSIPRWSVRRRVGHRPDAGEESGGDARRHRGSPQCRCWSGQRVRRASAVLAA